MIENLNQEKHTENLDQPEIVVVGSVNLDFVVEVESIPVTGETVIGGDLSFIPGGKGANQAVAAARLGRRTAIIGRVGDDSNGLILRKSIESAGVAVDGLLTTNDTPSGAALIAIDANGDNAIVVSPGSNNRLSADDVTQHNHLISSASAVLLQLEVPLTTVEAAVRCASGIVILNPAPVPKTPLPTALLKKVTILVPNQTELARLAGYDNPTVVDRHTAVQLARRLATETVVVTLGADGAVVVTDTDAIHVAAPQVKVIDTTAAGDAFCAALADALISGASPAEATRWATQVGAATTTKSGAQPSLPTVAAVKEMYLVTTDTAT